MKRLSLIFIIMFIVNNLSAQVFPLGTNSLFPTDSEAEARIARLVEIAFDLTNNKFIGFSRIDLNVYEYKEEGETRPFGPYEYNVWINRVYFSLFENRNNMVESVVDFRFYDTNIRDPLIYKEIYIKALENYGFRLINTNIEELKSEFFENGIRFRDISVNELIAILYDDNNIPKLIVSINEWKNDNNDLSSNTRGLYVIYYINPNYNF